MHLFLHLKIAQSKCFDCLLTDVRSPWTPRRTSKSRPRPTSQCNEAFVQTNQTPSAVSCLLGSSYEQLALPLRSLPSFPPKLRWRSLQQIAAARLYGYRVLWLSLPLYLRSTGGLCPGPQRLVSAQLQGACLAAPACVSLKISLVRGRFLPEKPRRT